MNELDIQLENIDEQLLTYPPKQRWIIYIGSALGILIMGWMFYLSDNIDELSAIQEQNSQPERQIQESSPDAYRSKISSAVQNYNQEKIKTIELENEKQILLTQMQTSQGLLFDNRQYAKMLDLLLENSVKSGLKIKIAESEESNAIFFGSVREFKKLTITGNGDFNAIANFLTFIEGQNALVQIQTLQIRTDESKPSFDLVVMYFGVSL